VRLISAGGQQIGVVPIEEALRRAQEENLDLVEISPTAVPPVCKLMDYGKYKYQQQKKEHDQRRKQHSMSIKQIRIKSFLIDNHDVEIKRRQAREFIEAGHRVVFTLMFRARENQHAEAGEALLVEKFAKPLADVSRMDGSLARDGRKMMMTLSPLPNLRQILAQRARAGKKAGDESAAPPKTEGAASPNVPAAGDSSASATASS